MNKQHTTTGTVINRPTNPPGAPTTKLHRGPSKNGGPSNPLAPAYPELPQQLMDKYFMRFPIEAGFHMKVWGQLNAEHGSAGKISLYDAKGAAQIQNIENSTRETQISLGPQQWGAQRSTSWLLIDFSLRIINRLEWFIAEGKHADENIFLLDLRFARPEQNHEFPDGIFQVLFSKDANAMTRFNLPVPWQEVG